MDSQLQTQSKVLTIYMQANAYHVFRSGDSTTHLVQARDKSISFWGCILFVDYGLHKQVTFGGQAIFHD